MAAVVAITGISGQLGGTLARLLEDDGRVGRVVGIDVRPLDQALGKTRFIRRDVTEPGLEGLFRAEGVTHVAHFAFLLDTVHDRALARKIDVEGSRQVLAAAGAVRAAKVVFSSSSVVFGAYPGQPAALPEEHPRRPHPRLQYALDKVAVEDLCAAFAREHPGTGVVVLRPVTIVGPRMANFIARTLDKPVLVAAWGHDPAWQVVHEVDCARAAQVMLFNDLRGVYNLGADGTVPFSELARLAGRRLVALPRLLLKGLADACWYLRLTGLSEVHGPLVDYQCYLPVLDNGKIKREAGFTFRYTTREALEEYFRVRAARQPEVVPGTGAAR